MIAAMSTSDAVPVVIGAVIGASGAVLAQASSAVFTARRESARLKWEQQRQDRDWKIREEERFLSHRQELYSRYLQLAHDFLNYIDDAIRTPGQLPERPDQAELTRLRWSVALVTDESVADAAGAVVSDILLAMFMTHANKQKDRERYAERAREGFFRVFSAMHKDLYGDQARLERVTRA
jgi:hypothetical protein